MSKVTDDLRKIVDEVARGGALTPDAIKQFDRMRENLESAEEELRRVKEHRDACAKESAERFKELEVLRASLKVRIEGVDKLHAREMEWERMRWLFEHERDRRLDMRGIISEVFKNFELSTAFSKSIPVPVTNNGFTTVQYHADSQLTTARHNKEST